MPKCTCELCKGTGYTTSRILLENLVHLLLIAAADCEKESVSNLHPWLMNIACWHPEILSKDIIDLTVGLTEDAPGFLGYGSIARYKAVRKVIQSAGLDPDKWGICQKCKGEGKY